MSAPDDPPPVTERDKVDGWRLHVLLRAGYPFELAEKIAASGCDLHLAVDLVAGGCPHATAAEIVL